MLIHSQKAPRVPPVVNDASQYAAAMLDSWSEESIGSKPSSGHSSASLQADVPARRSFVRQAAGALHDLLDGCSNAYAAGSVLKHVCGPFGSWVAKHEREHGLPPFPVVLHFLQSKVEFIVLLAMPKASRSFVVPFHLYMDGKTYSEAAAVAVERLKHGHRLARVASCTRFWIMTDRKLRNGTGLLVVQAIVELSAPSLTSATVMAAEALSAGFGSDRNWSIQEVHGQVLGEGTFDSLPAISAQLPEPPRMSALDWVTMMLML